MIINYFKTHITFYITSVFLLLVFTLNLSIHYVKYLDVVDEEIYETKVEVLNIYEKENYYVLKLKNKNFTFFTNFENIDKITQLDYINIAFISKKISFFDFLKGFYTKTIYYETIKKQTSFTQTLIKSSDSQHYNEMTAELFDALFFAVPVSPKLRDICANYGISHLIALSGFHLAVLSFLIYWILYYPYTYFHTRYFPYRNKKYDLLIVVLVLLFVYVIITNIVPSLLRSFIMMLIGIYLLRQNIKLFSFTNLYFVFLVIIALFPQYLFSLSLWFSILGVFYIFLFIQYFKDLKSKIVQVLFFNFWIYLAMNPIVHYFFAVTTYEQLYSLFITLAFTLFYPLELFLHVIDYGGILDEYILLFLNYKFFTFDVSTALWFFVLYVLVSFLSIFYRNVFWFLNALLFGFTLYMYI